MRLLPCRVDLFTKEEMVCFETAIPCGFASKGRNGLLCFALLCFETAIPCGFAAKGRNVCFETAISCGFAS
jgi:hypothetical protein